MKSTETYYIIEYYEDIIREHLTSPCFRDSKTYKKLNFAVAQAEEDLPDIRKRFESKIGYQVYEMTFNGMRVFKHDIAMGPSVADEVRLFGTEL